MTTRHPHDCPWQPPRPREYPSRPGARAYPIRRWPITPAVGKIKREDPDDE